jgi:hypothetical protein
MMISEPVVPIDPRVRAAVAELQSMIAARYPGATFVVAPGEDPEGTYVTATVDVADTDEVFDVVVERLLELQVEDGVPVYVLPVRPVERVITELRARDAPSPLVPLRLG